MFELGFKDDRVERAIIFNQCETVEEIIECILPDENMHMRHTLVTSKEVKYLTEIQNYCHICDPANKMLYQSTTSLMESEENK
jgi:hypothetical protein